MNKLINLLIDILNNKKPITIPITHSMFHNNPSLNSGITPHKINGFGKWVGHDQIYRFLVLWQKHFTSFQIQTLTLKDNYHLIKYTITINNKSIDGILEMDILDNKISQINIYWLDNELLIENWKNIV